MVSAILHDCPLWWWFGGIFIACQVSGWLRNKSHGGWRHGTSSGGYSVWLAAALASSSRSVFGWVADGGKGSDDKGWVTLLWCWAARTLAVTSRFNMEIRWFIVGCRRLIVIGVTNQASCLLWSRWQLAYGGGEHVILNRGRAPPNAFQWCSGKLAKQLASRESGQVVFHCHL